jgi:lipoprotein-anchoring transpeptidase ErfK/SrfK
VIGLEFIATAVGVSAAWVSPGLSDRPTGLPVPPPDEVARVVEPAYLRTSPGGRAVYRIDSRTEFGRARVHPLARRSGDWVAVVTPDRPNGRLGWLPAEHVRVRRVRVRLHVDLSERMLRVVRDGETVRRLRVAVGAAGTPTPTGRFAITDRLPGHGPYGCCILALSAHQPSLADGWYGGDRIAIHGTAVTSSIGTAASNGCLRTTDRNMRRLVRLAPPGTTVLIRR